MQLGGRTDPGHTGVEQGLGLAVTVGVMVVSVTHSQRVHWPHWVAQIGVCPGSQTGPGVQVASGGGPSQTHCLGQSYRSQIACQQRGHVGVGTHGGVDVGVGCGISRSSYAAAEVRIGVAAAVGAAVVAPTSEAEAIASAATSRTASHSIMTPACRSC
jgi:hypothetical protein